MEDGGGAAAVSPTTVRSLGCLLENVTNNELEILAIALAVADFKNYRTNHPSTPNWLSVFSTSQTALNQVHEPLKPRPMQQLAQSVKLFIRDLGNTELLLFWVPGHEAIDKNEEADRAAWEAAEEGANKANLLPMSLSKLAQKQGLAFTYVLLPSSQGEKT